ncbi:MAG: hypothetical protein JRF04_00525 [Deltaproteobacteria bacterium]|nr:hypothetical protein [Deltaproteobacteria bacterium]
MKPVAFRERLNAGRMIMPSGIHREQIGSLSELYWFLAPSGRTLPAIDFDRLADWLETTIKDNQTAALVRRAAADESCYVDACKAVYGLVGARITEAEGVINNEHA